MAAGPVFFWEGLRGLRGNIDPFTLNPGAPISPPPGFPSNDFPNEYCRSIPRP